MNIDSRIVLNRFIPRPYQLPILDAIENKGYKRVLAILPRRAGKDITAWNLCIRAALRRVGTYFYVFPTYAQAKKVIWDSTTIDGQRFINYFIPDDLVESKNGQEMKIRFRNGSLIQLVGSDNIDGLVGTNPLGVIFSEYAIQDPRAYNFLRPILIANNGWCLFISCVSPETLVLMQDGLKRIKDVCSSRDEYTDLNQNVYGIGGFHEAEQFYYGGVQPTLKITLESGYSLECTPIHKIWNGSHWVESQHLKVGDLLPIQYGQDVWGSGLDLSGFSFGEHASLRGINFSTSDEDFFYLLGLIHADGNYNKHSVCITKKKDQEIIDFVRRYGFRTRPDGIHHVYSSTDFCSLLEFIGFKHGARNKSFPEKMFRCTKQQMASFLRGIFDGDGCSNSNPTKRGSVKLTSACIDFIQDLQVVLLNFGIVSSIRSEDKAPTKKVKVWSRIYNLEISGYFAHVFYRDIGFGLDRKQKNWSHVPESVREESGNVYPIDVSRLEGYSLPKNLVTNPKMMSRRLIRFLNDRNSHPYLEEILSENLFYSKISSIVSGESEVYDFVIPVTNSFFSRGFLSHNTPRGKNHLWEMFQIAKNNTDEWFAYKLTVEDTSHISLEDLEKEKQQGLMSEDFIQQEFYTSFEMGVEGAYYAQYLDKMRIKGQIGQVPWEPSFKVHTAWDLGVRDSTSIIFFQVVGQTVRIIDCYENSKVGLEHYIKVVNQKDYQYGKHIAPHDIKVREFTSGVARIDKARQLGINFTLSGDISVEDGIECVRSTLSKVWIDEDKCKFLIKALENYRQEYDIRKKVYKDYPLHDWSSHWADSMRYLCISLPKMRDGLSPEDLDRRYQEAMYGNQSHLSQVFHDPNSRW